MPTLGILRTKLYRPLLTEDLVAREHLLDRLESKRHQCALTLVSAPAGYGKSTLLSQWLKRSEHLNAWFSVDEDDNDLRCFLQYIIAALQTVDSAFGHETLVLLKEVDLPPWKVLRQTLLKELDGLREPCVLVLDDYHRLHNPDVHDLFRELLSHPLPSLHLVLITRHDPPLPLPRLRAQNQLIELHEQDLRFSASEIQAFLMQAVDISLDDGSAAILNEKIEGWVAGLRLIALSLRDRRDITHLLDHLPDSNPYVMSYLFEEILSQQPAEIQRCLLNTALLDRFCASLCEALCQDAAPGESMKDEQEFPALLTQQGLFVMALDDEHTWFRYHHLFQKLLQRDLHKQRCLQEIAALHMRASRWFESQALIDEALHHALAADDVPAAIRLVAQHRHRMLDQEQWPHLASWLSLFPGELIDRTPDLLMLKAWLHYHQMQLTDLIATLNQINACRDNMSADLSHTRQLRGEYAALRSYQHLAAATPQEMRRLAQHAMRVLPDEMLYARNLALGMFSFAAQMRGEFASAVNNLHQALHNESASPTSYHARLLTVLTMIHWLEADLPGLQIVATKQLDLSQKLHLQDSLFYAQYYLGEAHYQHNDLTKAEQLLTAVVNPSNPLPNRRFITGIFTLALTYVASGRVNDARTITDRLIAAFLEQGSPSFLRIAQVFKTDLLLRQGHLAEAVRRTEHQTLPPLVPYARAYLPHLTVAKVFLAQKTPESLRQAGILLTELREYHEGIHHIRFLIEILALQALLKDARAEHDAAMALLQEALRLAEPGRFLRLFVDLGPGMASLLRQCFNEHIHSSYVGQLLAAFRAEHNGFIADEPGAPLLPTALSARERAILTLLAQRLQNQEIAERLCISPETVKKHLYNMYQKLNVHHRREAIVRAKELGLLTES